LLGDADAENRTGADNGAYKCRSIYMESNLKWEGD